MFGCFLLGTAVGFFAGYLLGANRKQHQAKSLISIEDKGRSTTEQEAETVVFEKLKQYESDYMKYKHSEYCRIFTPAENQPKISEPKMFFSPSELKPNASTSIFVVERAIKRYMLRRLSPKPHLNPAQEDSHQSRMDASIALQDFQELARAKAVYNALVSLETEAGDQAGYRDEMRKVQKNLEEVERNIKKKLSLP
ncbi:MAG TPA: hypothetical protein PK274_10690 [Candidatus Fermentibacter daniensis]|nr:hypothetical protein [Candidatus Fermentibacter daniensis]